MNSNSQQTNQENLDAAMVMLENIKRNYYGEVNRNTKNRMNELLVLLKDKESKPNLLLTEFIVCHNLNLYFDIFQSSFLLLFNRFWNRGRFALR